jgi:hypothetical protein
VLIQDLVAVQEVATTMIELLTMLEAREVLEL